MTEEFASLYQLSLRARQEIRHLKNTLQEQEEAHRATLLQCYLVIIGELDMIEATARQHLSKSGADTDTSDAIGENFRQLRQPLLSVLGQQGVHRIPHPFNLLPEWSVLEGHPGIERPSDTSQFVVEKEGYAKGDWLIRPAVLRLKEADGTISGKD